MVASLSSTPTVTANPVAVFVCELDDLRRAAGLSFRELARRSGCPVSTVNDALRGRRSPRLATVLAIVTACGGDADSWRERWVELTSGPAPRRPVPAELPADIVTFTGRDALLAELLDDGASVVSISGPAGVGKTALAVHAAHRLAPRFPDGQLFVDLHGFTKGGCPTTPLTALARMLRALGVRDGNMPADLAGRAALFRGRLAGRRVLVVLDNARSADQVRPLLPAGPGSLALVTGRTTMAVGDAKMLDVDRLSDAEALALLERVVGDRIRQDPTAARRLSALCDRLPLAIRLAGALLASQPAQPVAELVDRLRQDSRLRVLEVPGDESTGLAAAFDVSYQALCDAARRLYRLLSLAPGHEFTVHVAAALLDCDVDEAMAVGSRLVAAHLVELHAADRYRFHDLLREDAHTRCVAEDADREQTRRRVLGWYLHSAANASAVIFPDGWAPSLEPVDSTCPPARFANDTAAMRWFNAEHANLFSAVRQAARHGLTTHAWQLVNALWGYVQWRRPWEDWKAANQVALAAARAVGDDLATALHSTNIGYAHWDRRDYATAAGFHRDALAAARRSGVDLLVQMCLGHLGNALVQTDRLGEGAPYLRTAVAMAHDGGRYMSEAALLNFLGNGYLRAGRYDDALDTFHASVRTLRRCANGHARGYATAHVGLALAAKGQHAEAIRWYDEALPLARAEDLPRYTGQILDWLGDSRQAMGEPAAARRAWQEALAILDGAADPTADEVRAKLTMQDAEG